MLVPHLFLFLGEYVVWKSKIDGHIDMTGPANYLLSELDDQRQLVGLDKSQEVLFGQLSIKCIAPFIKLNGQTTKKIEINISHLVSHLVCLWTRITDLPL